MAGGDGLGRVEGRGTVAGAIQKGIEDEGVLVAGVCCGVLEPRDRMLRQEAGLIDAGIGSAGSDPKLSPDCNMTGSFI